jgi:hypothetical protein
MRSEGRKTAAHAANGFERGPLIPSAVLHRGWAVPPAG